MDVSVIFVSYNTADTSVKALNKLYQSDSSIKFETFIIDNASRDTSVEFFKKNFPNVKLTANQVNVGFGRANNQVLNQTCGRYVLLLNTDAFIQPDTLKKTVNFMDDHPKVGILGVKLIGSDGTLQPSCRYFPTPLVLFVERAGLKKLFPKLRFVDDMGWDHSSVRFCDWVPGCFYLIRADVIKEVGLFDPRYFIYYEEVDHCLATKKAGWEVAYFPNTSVVHIGGESAKTDNSISHLSRQVSKFQIESELLYMRKNHGLLGLLLHVMLTILAEIIIIIKAILKRRFVLSTAFKPLFNFINILFSTNFGGKPIH